MNMASMAAFKTFFFIFLIIFTCPNSGDANGLSLKEGLKLPNPCGQVIVQKKVTRKLLGAVAFLDYASPDHNTRHEPRVGGPGGRASANP